jgi:uncharacterized membrane protein YccC
MGAIVSRALRRCDAHIPQRRILRLIETMPTRDELIFALKTFTGAMLALFIALWLGLDNPYWCMATAYIVAQPLTGAMRSKALYRFIGTISGGTASVVLVPNLVNAPLLLCLALAVWVGLCLYLSLLDRSPRAYLFMLAGYTAGIIGFPSVANPGDIFMTALTRVEEISLGIVCTTMVGTVVFPRPLGPVLAKRIAAWVRPGIDWAIQALSGNPEDNAAWTDRRRLAAESADITQMTSQLAYDTSQLQSATRHVQRLRLYVLSLMPVLSSISDRVMQLREAGGVTPALQLVLDACKDWVRAGGPENADAVHQQIIDQSEREMGAELSWTGILRMSLLERMAELVSIMRHARMIRRHVVEGAAAPTATPLEGEFVAIWDEVHDHGLALLSALAAGIAIMLVCGFWIATAWTAGAGAAVIVAVACSFFAAQDDPAPAIALMLRNAVVATAGAAVYLFIILPRVETFPELALVLLPAGLIIGVLVSRPATFGTGMVMGAFGSTSLALGNGYAGNFAGYVNNAIALVLGVAAALVVTRLLRSVGAAWSAKRLLRAGWQDIAAAAADHRENRAHLTGIMLDRLGLLMPRLAAVSPGADIAAADLLRDLRVGLNALALGRILQELPATAQIRAGNVLDGIASLYHGNPLAPPPPALLDEIDAAIRGAACDQTCHREALMLLVGLRSIFFAAAPPPLVESWERTPALAAQ